MTEQEALIKAVELLGGQTATAEKLTIRMNRAVRPIRQGHVWKWLNYGKCLPELYALHMQDLTSEAGCEILASSFCTAAYHASDAA